MFPSANDRKFVTRSNPLLGLLYREGSKYCQSDTVWISHILALRSVQAEGLGCLVQVSMDIAARLPKHTSGTFGPLDVQNHVNCLSDLQLTIILTDRTYRSHINGHTLPRCIK